MSLLLNIFLIFLTIVSGSLNELDAEYSVYGDQPDRELMQDFYKRLALLDLQDVKRLQPGDVEYEDGRFPVDYRNDNLYGERTDDEGMEAKDEEVEQMDKSAIIRDPELTQHSSNLGILQMSESEKEQMKPNSGSMKTIKSDDALPFYCHPPNPCPKGYSSKDNCQEFIEDTADYQKEWIQQMQRKGICSCDDEHMFDCNTGVDSMLVGSKEDMDKFFNKFIKEKEQQENPYTQRGQKRISLVAKKSPRIKRDSRHALMDGEMEKLMKESHKNNPYLEGNKLPTVAKKGFIKRNG